MTASLRLLAAEAAAVLDAAVEDADEVELLEVVGRVAAALRATGHLPGAGKEVEPNLPGARKVAAARRVPGRRTHVLQRG